MTELLIESGLPADLEELAKRTIGALLAVHRELGSGMTEGVYAAATRVELAARGIPFEREKRLPIHYRGQFLCHQRIDLFVDDRLVVELKSVEALHAVRFAQVVSYLRLTGARLGLLVNFNVPLLKHGGVRRVIL